MVEFGDDKLGGIGIIDVVRFALPPLCRKVLRVCFVKNYMTLGLVESFLAFDCILVFRQFESC